MSSNNHKPGGSGKTLRLSSSMQDLAERHGLGFADLASAAERGQPQTLGARSRGRVLGDGTPQVYNPRARDRVRVAANSRAMRTPKVQRAMLAAAHRSATSSAATAGSAPGGLATSYSSSKLIDHRRPALVKVESGPTPRQDALRRPERVYGDDGSGSFYSAAHVVPDGESLDGGASWARQREWVDVGSDDDEAGGDQNDDDEAATAALLARSRKQRQGMSKSGRLKQPPRSPVQAHVRKLRATIDRPRSPGDYYPEVYNGVAGAAGGAASESPSSPARSSSPGVATALVTRNQRGMVKLPSLSGLVGRSVALHEDPEMEVLVQNVTHETTTTRSLT